MTDSNKGWHSEWFYVANPPLPLPKFSGRFAQKLEEWEWATGKDEKKAWIRPMLELLRQLKDAGLTGVKVLWTFFERRVQPLAARARPLFRYTGAGDLIRTSPEPLTPGEVRSRVWAVIKRAKAAEDDTAELERHEASLAPELVARDEGYDPAIPLRSKMCYPPLPEGKGSSSAAASLGQVSGQSGDAPTFVGEALRNMEPAPTVEVESAQPNPDMETWQVGVAQPTAPPVPAVTLVTPPPARVSVGSSIGAKPWEQFLPRTSSPLLRATPTAALGTGGSATTVATGLTAAEEIPPGGAAAGETEVPDLTGDASEEEDMAAMLEAVIDEEVAETDPERSEALPDEAAPEEWALDMPLGGAPVLPVTASVAPMDRNMEAAEAPGGVEASAALPRRVDTQATSGALVPARPAVPASERGKEPTPPEALPEASAESSSGWDVDEDASSSGHEITWRRLQTGEVLFTLNTLEEEELATEMPLAVRQLTEAFAQMDDCRQRVCDRNATKAAFL
ncbi:hypothetical protein BAE44_0021479 [Dichanthelium oligosanthes]|uniref:Uncharacterized protein n=1 Tax=Dichanthelium oligosanthes TaxID=888268 RepID=A0A1E5UX43_9POAL|nr:hypothetical protein BAE44_0021479 [Dichanthelium oligosanthes]